ncbi:MAG: helix-turn-helix domain-containing protein [Bacteroidales bacterium]|nr:helix-turn-helix domain-containing protein [Bacteroidales bacterium]
MNYSKIKLLLSERNIPISEMTGNIGISEQGFHQMVRKRSMKIETLEKISIFLNVDVKTFFDDDPRTVIELQEPVVKYNKKELSDKDKYTESLERENIALRELVDEYKKYKK